MVPRNDRYARCAVHKSDLKQWNALWQMDLGAPEGRQGRVRILAIWTVYQDRVWSAKDVLHPLPAG